jgi:hypothetical protein
VADGVTPQTGIDLVLFTFLVVYLGLTAGLLKLLLWTTSTGDGNESSAGDLHVDS